jgi:hypothetical protein
MFQSIEPFRKEVVADECNKKLNMKTACYKTKPYKIVVDHDEVVQVVLSCMCMWLVIYRSSYFWSGFQESKLWSKFQTVQATHKMLDITMMTVFFT